MSHYTVGLEVSMSTITLEKVTKQFQQIVKERVNNDSYDSVQMLTFSAITELTNSKQIWEFLEEMPEEHYIVWQDNCLDYVTREFSHLIKEKKEGK